MKWLLTFIVAVVFGHGKALGANECVEIADTKGICSFSADVGQTGLIKSQGWPDTPYKADTAQRWNITATSDAQIVLVFQPNFEIESNWGGACYDSIQVINPLKYGGNIGDICSQQVAAEGILCGTQPPTVTTVDSSNVVIDFCTDTSGQFKGFEVEWMIVPKAPPTPLKCGVAAVKPGSQRIVGGTVAVAHSWPWAAALFSSNGQFCGGTLISDRWIVTAAHCFFSKIDPSGYRVKLGGQNVGTDWSATEDSQQVLNIDKWILHEHYNPSTLSNDIALLKLAQIPVVNDFVRPICLGLTSNVLQANDIVEIVGWGTTYQGASSTSPLLMQVALPIVDFTECQKDYRNTLDDTMICAGYVEGGKDSCQGDSGGPLMKLRGQNWFLEGVVSWGDGCAKPNKPGIYSKMSLLSTWVNTTISANS